MLKFALYGHSGSGKSTCAKIVKQYFEKKNLSTEVVKLAYPLYKIQKEFYDVGGKQIDFYEQDQELLELIATNLRRISKSSLVDDFMKRLNKSEVDVIINDDIRDYEFDYPALKKENFKFIKIQCDEETRIQRLSKRNDLTVKSNSSTTSNIDKFIPDFVIDTTRGVENEINKIEKYLENHLQ